ncbi:MAG: CHAT domain-containing protein [Bacteroidota bacterium]
MELNAERIRDLIARADIEIAINELADYLNRTSHPKLEEAITLSARFSNNERLNRLGILSYGELKLERNQIINALFELIKELERKTPPIGGGQGRSQSHGHGQAQASGDISEKNTILFLTASPRDEDRTRSIAEVNNIETELRKSKFRDKFIIRRKDDASISDLLDGLLEYDPHIVHFAGHGDVDGIKLMGKHDKSKVAPNEALAALFSQFSDKLACVFLNSCFSEVQGKLICKHIDNVIGMKAKAPVDTAMEFSKNFYKSLGAGKNIDFSFRVAKISTDLSMLSGSDLPVLLHKDIA